MFQAVLFDLIGTTVMEKDPDLINTCFDKAFRDNQISADRDFILANRGKDKADIIEQVVMGQKLPLAFVPKIYSTFKHHVEDNLDKFSKNEGAEEIFLYLKQRNIKVGLGTGLSRDLFRKILDRMRWNRDVFDYIGISNEIGKSRPDPAMIFDMMNKLKISDARKFLKVGDTVADIQEGKNAKVITVALASGTQQVAVLEKEDPDFIINNLSEIKEIVADKF